jgi:ribonuclease VapC
MAEFVFDASAILAVAFNETGSEKVIARMRRACVSSVNYSEACAKMIDKGFGSSEASDWLDALQIEVVDFARPEALEAAAIRGTVAWKRISFADRACVSLAARIGAAAVTTDRIWTDLDLPCRIELIR